VVHLADIWRGTCQKPFYDLVQHNGLRLVDFEERRRVHVESARFCVAIARA